MKFLLLAIIALFLYNGNSFAQPAGFNIPFSLFFMGRILRHGGVGNEVHLRIFDRTKGGFTRVQIGRAHV